MAHNELPPSVTPYSRPTAPPPAYDPAPVDSTKTNGTAGVTAPSPTAPGQPAWVEPAAADSPLNDGKGVGVVANKPAPTGIGSDGKPRTPGAPPPLSTDGAFGPESPRPKKAGIYVADYQVCKKDGNVASDAPRTDYGTKESPSKHMTDAEIEDEVRGKTNWKVEHWRDKLQLGPVPAWRVRDELLAKDIIKPGPTPKGPAPVVMDSVLVPHPYNPDRMVSIAKVGPADKIAADKAAGQRENDMRAGSGVMAGGMPGKGSASQNIVPRAPQDKPARIVTPMPAGPNKPEAKPFGGATAIPPRAHADYLGKQREIYVAKELGGTLARDPKHPNSDLPLPYKLPNGEAGNATTDVIGKNGELIAVGGPSKANNLPATAKALETMKAAADARGVKAQAYFTTSTPPEVLKVAREKLGADNVKTFPDVDYQVPPDPPPVKWKAPKMP